jgi:hypothetical protein
VNGIFGSVLNWNFTGTDPLEINDKNLGTRWFIAVKAVCGIDLKLGL